MKIEHKPEAYGLIAGLMVMLLGVIATCSSCARLPPSVEPRGVLRTVSSQADAAYRVTVWCIDDRMPAMISVTRQGGSAVAVDEHHLLTALHVIVCDTGAPAITLMSADGTHIDARPSRTWPTKDVAELYVERQLGAPATIGSVRAGMQICARHGMPEFGEDCGVVTSVDAQRPDADIIHTAHTEHGNSGGGVYDGTGHLVGIVTQLIMCLPGLPLSCGGRASSLEGVLW